VKKAAGLLILLAAIAFIVISNAFDGKDRPPDAVLINEAVQAVLPGDTAVYATVTLLSDHLAQTFSDMDAARQNRDRALQISLYIIVIFLTLAGLFMCVYFERAFFAPFHRLKAFARRIAAGDLDMPLEMDKRNLFGAFTESFDLMREQLRTARENEYKVNQSKKELVASLSHDIKTPVASIMSAMDLMLVKAKDEKERRAIMSVTAKLTHIDALVTNMFHATLEELQALKVTSREIQSTEIIAFIKNADYKGCIDSLTIPDCIVLADPLRLQQVFDNIISNSYKHANTRIAVDAFVKNNKAIISVRDFGAGVPEEELPLLFNKFYRGKNAGQTEGYGLGLYLSKYFMEQMNGALTCANHPQGFVLTLSLKLA
jgi:signal transduction histidine kinase